MDSVDIRDASIPCCIYILCLVDTNVCYLKENLIESKINKYNVLYIYIGVAYSDLVSSPVDLLLRVQHLARLRGRAQRGVRLALQAQGGQSHTAASASSRGHLHPQVLLIQLEGLTKIDKETERAERQIDRYRETE